ncbi:MAG: redoxin [Gammaproteobacteria bacterium HGW-Gammaproteobacteria-8]|nr:MAG: redoxin [Gammaproteobacteria bacterium HGW-Gammaproteobacteria-8]
MSLLRTLVLAALAGLALGLGGAWLFRPAVPNFGPTTVELLGSPRPDFTLADPAGQLRRLADFDGRALLINFWATWCAPCIREMPLLQKLADSRTETLTVLGIAIDEPGAVDEFLERLQISYPNLLAGEQSDAIQAAFGNPGRMLPFSVLVDADGIIRWQHLGELDQDLIEPALTRAGVE